MVVNTCTGVLDSNSHVLSGSCFKRPYIAVIKNGIFGFNIDFTTAGHGLPCIHEKIQEHLLDLPEVGRDVEVEALAELRHLRLGAGGEVGEHEVVQGQAVDLCIVPVEITPVIDHTSRGNLQCVEC